MTPSVPLVHAILSRANLPLDTVALAVCILDSLDRRFALSWRLACPPGRAPDEEQTPPPPAAAVPGQRPLAGQRLASPTCSPSSPVFAHTHMRCRSDFVTSPFSSSATAFDQQHRQHIDRVPPEIIIVAALVLAVKFLDDTRDPATAYYGREWGRGMWTCAQINATERCIMACLGYRIMPLWDAELIRDARRDMERAAEEARREEAKAARRGCGMRETLGKRVALGLATPEHTPVEEEAKQLAMPASGVA